MKKYIRIGALYMCVYNTVYNLLEAGNCTDVKVTFICR